MVGSPDFPGTNSQVINAKANRYLLTHVIPQARRARVRIWPLGFGRDANLYELQPIAAGGALGSCDAALPDATPHAIHVLSAADIKSALPQIFANARCLHYTPGPKAKVGFGASVDLYVTVPDIVTFGSIEVARRYQQISVTDYDPDNSSRAASVTWTAGRLCAWRRSRPRGSSTTAEGNPAFGG